MNRCLLFAASALLALPATGREYAPRVVSPHNADAYSMLTFRQYPRWKNLTGDALAWEVYQYLVDNRTGLFHMNEVVEGRDVLSEYRTVRDPVKIINGYGYAYCGILGPVMAGVWQDMGLGPARTLSLPAWNHVTTEVFYDNGWHYVDLDVRAVFRRGDGSLASMAAARQDPALWTGRGPLFFPNDDLDRTRDIYRRTPVHHYHGFNQSGHTMDYVLRQGESLTRWWQPQGERWHHAEVYHQTDLLRQHIESSPRGPKPNHRHFTVHNYANGRFVYQPNLTEKSTDFADGVFDSQNVRPGPNGLTLIEPGEGYVIFEVHTPYIMVPLVGRMETTEDDREASVVEIDSVGATLSVSLDNGITWQDVTRNARSAALDLTHLVSGTYGYLLKIALSGQPDDNVVRRLGITTWVQVAPAALPSLRAGRNQMEYRTGDHYGLQTRVKEVVSNASDRSDLDKHTLSTAQLAKYGPVLPVTYDTSNKTERIRGTITVRVRPPPHTKIAWFLASGSFRTHQGEGASKTRNAMAYAVDLPTEFRKIYHARVPTDTAHWHYNASREIKLDRPAEMLFVRYTGDPALNNFRIYAHCLDDARPSDRPVRITHVWSEPGGQQSKTVDMTGAGTYEILTGEEPVDKSIEIAVPSDTR